MATTPIFLANSDRGRFHKPSLHSPLHLGEVGLTHTKLSVTTCTLVSRYVHLYTHATSFQSYVQGDKYLDLPDTTIHGVTEQTRHRVPRCVIIVTTGEAWPYRAVWLTRWAAFATHRLSLSNMHYLLSYLVYRDSHYSFTDSKQ